MSKPASKLDSTDCGKEWAVILAGGDGTRLKSLTRKIAGDERPKQFCSVLGKVTLLEETRARAALELARERTLYVVNRIHEPYYGPILRNEPVSNLVVHPAIAAPPRQSSIACCESPPWIHTPWWRTSLRTTTFPTTNSLWLIFTRRWKLPAAEPIWLYCLDWIRKVRKWNTVGSNRRSLSAVNRESMAFIAFGKNPINCWPSCCNFAAACGTVL